MKGFLTERERMVLDIVLDLINQGYAIVAPDQTNEYEHHMHESMQKMLQHLKTTKQTTMEKVDPVKLQSYDMAVSTWNTKQLAQMCGISIATARKICNEPGFPAKKIFCDGRWIFDIDAKAAVAWLKERGDDYKPWGTIDNN